MPPPRTPLGGPFGGGTPPRQPPTTDVAGLIDVFTNGASSLLQGAFARKMALRNREHADALERQRREDMQAQRQVEAEQRQAQAQERTYQHQRDTERAAIDREKMATSERQHAETLRTSLRAKGLATKDDVALHIPGGDGGPPVEQIDPAHYADEGGGLVRDLLHNPDASAATRDARHEAAAETRIRLSASLRPPRRAPADPIERERRAYITQRVRELMKPTRGAGGLSKAGQTLEQALETAHTEASRIYDGDDEAVAAPPASGTGGIDLNTIPPPPAAAQPGPRIRVPGAAAPLPPVRVTAPAPAPGHRAPLSAAQKALAKSDPGFAAHLQAQGYTPADWQQP